MGLIRNLKYFIASAVVAFIGATILETQMLKTHPSYHHVSVLKPPKNEDTRVKNIFLIMPVIEVDEGPGQRLEEICTPPGALEFPLGALEVPADMGTGMYKVLAVSEWSVLETTKVCYHDWALWKHDTSVKEIDDYSSAICRATHSEYSTDSSIKPADCTLFHDAESRGYVRTRYSSHPGKVIYINGSRFIHTSRSNFPIDVSKTGPQVLATNKSCVAYEIQRQGLTIEAQKTNYGFKLGEVFIPYISPITDTPESNCSVTKFHFEVCETLDIPAVGVSPLLGIDTLQVNQMVLEARRKQALLSHFCLECSEKNSIESDLKLICLNKVVKKIHYSLVRAHLKYSEGMFTYGDYVFDTRLGTLVPEESAKQVPKFEYMPHILYVYNLTSIANCTVDLQTGKVESPCSKMEIQSTISYPEILDKYTVSSIYYPKLIQRVSEMRETFHDFAGDFSNLYTSVTSWVMGWIQKAWISFVLCIAALMTLWMLIKYKMTPRPYEPIRTGRRGTVIS